MVHQASGHLISSSGHLIIPSNLAGSMQESPTGLKKTAEDDAWGRLDGMGRT